MNYFLFIDDTRFPSDVYSNTEFEPWVVARNFEDVKNFILELGFPTRISFDTDLGENEPSGFDIAKCLCELDLDDSNHLSHLSFSSEFTFAAHSNNFEANKNIENYLSNYIRIRDNDTQIKSDMSKMAFGM